MLGVPINMYCNSLYIEKNYCKVKFNFTLMALALCFVLLSVGRRSLTKDWFGVRAGANPRDSSLGGGDMAEGSPSSSHFMGVVWVSSQVPLLA